MPPAASPIRLFDSITQAPKTWQEAPVLVCGSHGGLAAAMFALQRGVKGVIFNDAGVGRQKAGIAGLEVLEQHGVMGACVDAFTARIGSARETLAGRISHANQLARRAGVKPGQEAALAAELISRTPWTPPPLKDLDLPAEKEEVLYRHPDGRRIVALDSNSMIRPEHRRDVVCTGSHGGLVGRQPAVKHPVLAAFYNDAGIGKQGAGLTRLPWLEQRGIIGATVAADSARIGVGRDTYENGIISALNRLARELGLEEGMPARRAARLILERCPA